jgi:hypothetical protein
MVYGWRIPFLASSVSATAALALRLHMPEPSEFLQVGGWVGGWMGALDGGGERGGRASGWMSKWVGQQACLCSSMALHMPEPREFLQVGDCGGGGGMLCYAGLCFDGIALPLRCIINICPKSVFLDECVCPMGLVWLLGWVPMHRH